MKKMKLNLLAAAAIMAASAPAFASMADATSGNGSLLLNLRSYNGSAVSGANDMSALFDLGVSMNDVIAWNGVSGFTQTWNLTAANYGSAWSTLNTFASGPLGSGTASIEYNVIALDNTDLVTPGGSRYLTTYTGTGTGAFPALINSNLNGFDLMNGMVVANNSRGTHATDANGASTAMQTDAAGSYFGAANGLLSGDSWATKTTADTTKTLATAQNFWYLTTSSVTSNGAATKVAFGVDLDGDNLIEADNNGTSVGGVSEFGKWSVNAATGTLTYTNPTAVPVPAAAWLLASGLIGMVGVARRKAA